MTDRRTEILDGALGVLAENGMRGLTHRAVDQATGIPPGSTSYYFRTRSALVTGCVARLLELDLSLTAPLEPDGMSELIELTVGFGVAMVTVLGPRTLARYELSLAGMRDPELRRHLVRGGDVLRAGVAEALTACGHPAPEQAAAELAGVLDGLAFTALLRGPHDPDALAAWFRPVLTRLLSPSEPS